MKKRIKVISIMLLTFILLASIIYSITVAVTTFTTGTINENITFTGNQNITRYINVPMYSKIINATIKITGDQIT